MRLSICIPTYNRAQHLTNCLESIRTSRAGLEQEVEVCVSDNASTDHTEEVVRRARQYMPIKYQKNAENVRHARNYLKVVRMAEGEFIWLLGDDDLVMPDGLQRICRLIREHPSVDFFFLNSLHLTTEFVFSHPQPFDTAKLPADMMRFSMWQNEGELPFFDLIDPRIAFDFLGGMFLAIFRREPWTANEGALDHEAIHDTRTFSHFDNTFPHVKIWSQAFAKSNAYFNAVPPSVNLTGAREWAPMYLMVRSVRLIEALQEYRKNGLSLKAYLRCKNFALNTFIPDLAYLFLNKESSGYHYVRPVPLVLANFLYPNFYLSVWYYVSRKTGEAVARFRQRGQSA
jgi:glycosyltransferase involved in cell wall biosynthesis